MSLQATCPKSPEHKVFVTAVHEIREWLVTDQGAFIADGDCLEVATPPDRENIWQCVTCGEQAVVIEILPAGES